MNYSTAVFLVNSNVRAVACIYEENEQKRTLFKTFDPDIAKDDIVIVPTHTRMGFTAVKVVEVDVTVDFDSSTQMGWIAGRLDRREYDKVLKQEEKVIDAVKAAEFKRKRDELSQSLMAKHAEDLRCLELTTADALPGAVPPKAPPPDAGTI